MSFRRIPFQFSSTNPADRQSELMRRFGVPSEDKMFTENAPSPFMDALSHSSPRLQHRIPGFLGNDGQQSEVNQNHAENVDHLPKAEPKVRIVPIHIEGQSEKQDRHRTHSGGASIPIVTPGNPVGEEQIRQRINSGSSIPSLDSLKTNTAFIPSGLFFSHRKPKESSGVPQTEAKVCNIPVNLEGEKNSKGAKLSHSKTAPLQKEAPKRSASNMGNGPCMSKSANEPPADEMKDDKRQKTDIDASLKQIEAILKEFKAYEDGVDEFSGVQNDKRYRYLDEMLTRCMLKLDDIETFGNEEVRKARKAAIKRVQDAINVLDSKVQPKSGESEPIEDKESVTENEPSPVEVTATEDVDMAECTVENQTSMNGDISENKSDLDGVPDSDAMEVKVSKKDAAEIGCGIKNNIESVPAVLSEDAMHIAFDANGETPKDGENTNVETMKEIEEIPSADASAAVTCTNPDSLTDPCVQHTNEASIIDSNMCGANSKDSVIANGQLVPSTDESSQNIKIEDVTETKDGNLHTVCVQVPMTLDSALPPMNDVEHENEVSVQS